MLLLPTGTLMTVGVCGRLLGTGDLEIGGGGRGTSRGTSWKELVLAAASGRSVRSSCFVGLGNAGSACSCSDSDRATM